MPQYTRLCLNGGGVRGALQVGALKAYADIVGTRKLHTVFTEGVYGISIGAILCAFVAFGFDIDEMTNVLHKFTLTDLIEAPRLQNILELSTRKGLDTGEKIHNCLRDIFREKGLDFDRLTIGDALVPLYIIASDITRSKPVAFYEKILLWDAIRASISLPLVFTPHIIRGRVFVDGAIGCAHVTDMVPTRFKHTALSILSANIRTKNIENADAFTFMSHIAGVRTNAIVRGLIKDYPENICLLTENSTSMLSTDANNEYLISVGYESGRTFFTKSACQEGPVSG